jgi:hypothetical protein
MKELRKNIDEIVSKVLSEAINEKANMILETAKENSGKLHGNQSKIDVAEPKGKITAADFKKLRDKKDDGKKRTPAGFEHGEIVSGDMGEELHGKQKKLDKNNNNKIDSEDFKMLRKSNKKETAESWDETSDGKGWSDAQKLSNQEPLYRGTKFVKEESFGDDDIEDVKAYGDFTTDSPKKIGKVKNVGDKYQRKVSKEFKNESVKNTLTLTEDEMIELIEKIVKEQTAVKATNKSLKTSEKVNDDNIKSVTKKMKEYLKTGSKETYEPNPKHFPKGNGELAKMTKKAYVPSDAVEEYEDAFSYPGQTNLRFDEIAPNDEVIEKYLEGDSSTGNSQEYANAVASNTGKKFMKNYKENLYGAEQADASYKRQPQPVDLAGDDTSDGKLSSKRGGKKTSAQKAEKILNQLESVDDKKTKILTEDLEKMRHLLSYNKKTQ